MSNLKVYAKTIEDEALEQINTLLSQDAFKDCKVRIMPDVHAGKGCVIGFTADLGNKVIPNIVGVDIGCGMLCVSIGHGEIDFDRLDKSFALMFQAEEMCMTAGRSVLMNCRIFTATEN